MKKKKIIYVITKSVWGGAQRYVFDLATNLPKDRFNVIVATGGGGPLIRRLHEANVPIISIPRLERDINPVKEIASLWSLFKILKQERPDIVHLNSSKAGGLGAVAAWLAGVPKIIFTAHGWAFQEPRPWWQRSLIIFLSWLASQFQHHIINISKRDYEATIAYRLTSPKKAALLPLGITIPGFVTKIQAREFLSQKTGRVISPDAPLAGTIAELTKNKGLGHLIDAVNQMKSKIQNSKFKTIIIGEGEDKEKLKKQIDSLGLQNTVYLAGFIPDAAKYLKAFDIFVLPSLKEGLPYTLLETKMAGVPVAASDIGGMPDIIRHGKDGLLVEPANPEKLAGAIEALLNKGALSTPADADNTWTIEEMLKKTIALYES